MEIPPRINKELENLIETADATLTSVDQTTFSPSAFSELKVKISSYIADLVEESFKVSKRDGVDLVSVKHVGIANESLKQINSKGIYKHLGTIGGIFFGFCLPNIYTMVDTGKYTTFGVLSNFIIGIIGACLLVVSFIKE